MVSIVSKPVIRTVLELQTLFAEYGNGPRCEVAASVPHVRSKLLTAAQTAILSTYVVEHSWEGYVDPNVEGMLQELLGLKIAEPNDSIFLTIGKESFVATRNKNNRKRTIARIKPVNKDGSYSNLMVRGLWATIASDPFCFDWNSQIQSAQHRLDGMIEAKRANPDLVLPMVKVVIGIPPQLRDWMDKAKARSKSDDNTVDETMLPVDAIQLVNLHTSGLTTEPQARADERIALLKIQSKVAETLQRRLEGQDYYPQGAKQSTEDELKYIDLCGTVTVDGFESETITMEPMEVSALGYLVAKVVASMRGQSGKIDSPASGYFAPAIVASALVLASNGEDVLKEFITANYVADDTLSVEERATERLKVQETFLSPDAPINIDFVLVDKVLTMLGQSTDKEGGGPLGSLLFNLSESIKKHKVDTDAASRLYKPSSIASMSAMVQLVKNVQDSTNILTSDPTATNEATVALNIPIFTKYKANKEGEFNPSYRCFGGKDVGFIERKKGKKKAE